jgi:hypothetical protein
MRRFLQIAVLAGVIGALIGAGLTLAASSGTNNSSQSGDKQEYRHAGPPFGRGAVLSAAASKLGVSATQLRDALRKAEAQVGPPNLPQNPNRNSLRQAFHQHCTAVTDAAAKTLGKSGDELRSALKSAAKEQVDKAQGAGRLTQAEANRIKSRIDASSCVLGPGPHGACGPGGRMGPPPMGLRRGGSQTAPQSGMVPADPAIPA